MNELSCPLPHIPPETVQLGHGSGGVLMHRLLERTILPALSSGTLREQHDSAVLELGGSATKRLAFTTDSYVVRPLFFPGGDIGTLAVFGTVNDLAMVGARPTWLSVSLILEEGLPLPDLQRVLASMKTAADAVGISIVTGDTKVVDRGHGDGLYVNTAGVGIIEHELLIGPSSIREGDVILLSGDLGRHGISILAEREGLEFETTLTSDTAPLHSAVLALMEAGVRVHCLRDLTRGGLASALKELMFVGGLSAEIRERDIQIEPQVRGACEMLGLDPLYVANEGRMVVIVPPDEADRALAILASLPVSAKSAAIGTIQKGQKGEVVLRSRLGSRRVVDMLPGEQLPRIC
ncbi:MAG: hydrogenase expression/formation protein HypE [Chthoniobacter sp.]|nr:hydrogenase expression/formation protein HypE [Chthoniobacter sp.]